MLVLKQLSRRQFYLYLYIIFAIAGMAAVIAVPPRDEYWGSESGSTSCENEQLPKPGLFDYSDFSGAIGPCDLWSEVNFQSLSKVVIFWLSNVGWFYLFLFQRMKLWTRLLVVAPLGFVFTIASAIFLLPWGWLLR